MNFLITLCCLLLFIAIVCSKSELNKLLVVSYDGFRYDYLDLHKNATPVLNALKLDSSYAKCLLNVFPTQTFPNHFTIATGLYSGIHGVLGSRVYDSKSKKVFSYDSLFHYNDDVLPIWALNEKSGEGRHSGVMMWPGSNLEYHGIRPTFVYNYSYNYPYEKRVSTVMSWFNHPKTPANLVMLYFEEPDANSHSFGPDGIQTIEQMTRVDNITKYIMDSLSNNNLTDVNIIFLSDHGMEGVTMDRIINLNDAIGSKADMYGTSPVMQIYPKPGENIAEVYHSLKDFEAKHGHFKVYLKGDIPEHFYIKDCERTPPILAVADAPYAFQDLYESIDWLVQNRNASKNGTFGVHGYDPNDIKMHPYFIAHGPLFKRNFNAGELRTVDLFSLFSEILKVKKPPVKSNGTLAGMEKLFTSSAPMNFILPVYFIIGFLLCTFSIILGAAVCLHRRKSIRLRKGTELNETEAEKLLETTCSV